jgi:tripartite ATP-independent transporter DctP family solute receptor
MQRFIIACATALSLGVLTLPTVAAEFTARWSLDVPEGHPKYQAAEQFARAVAEGTGNAVEIKVFGNGLLGGEAESAEGIRLGSVQGGTITSSVFATWVPDVQVLDLPFLFRDDAHAVAANGLLTKRLSEQFVTHGFHLLGFSVNGARQLMSSFPVEKPEDLHGKKMRVIQSPIHVALWEAVGVNPVAIPAAEVYNSMQTRVVDLFDNTATNYQALRFYEVAPHYTNLSHVYAMGTWVLAETFWQKLPAEYQEVITAAALKAQSDLVSVQQAQDQKALAETVAAGSTIHEVADKQVWIELMQPVYDQFAPTIPNAVDTIKAVKAIQ